MMQGAYQAGQVAPQAAFEGTVLRSVGQQWEAGALDHTKASPGRYNAANERLIYTAPDMPSLLKEATPYQRPGMPALSERSVVSLDYRASPDAHGRGGVADLAEGARRVGLPPGSLTQAKGPASPSWLHQLTGEHPYTLPQQAAKGAADAGASGLRAPSAEAGHQINIVARNTHPDQVRPASVLRYDAQGQAGTPQAASHIRPMPANDLPTQAGPLSKPAGLKPTLTSATQPGRHLGAMNQSPEPQLRSDIKSLGRQWVNGASEGYPRAASTRYGAVGGALATLADAGVAVAKGQSISASKVGQNVASNAALGGGAAKAVDLLAPRMGLVKAGGAVGGAIQASVSGYHNYQAYQAGQISGAKAVANTVVDTGTAVAAGAAGAAVGAAVGSVLPVAGTAAGAVVGFGVGMGVHYGIQAVDRATGMLDHAKSTLTTGLQSAQSMAGQAWSAVTPW